jgi:hypothetical protein
MAMVDHRIVVRLLRSGTDSGAYSGVPETGKVVRVSGLAIWRFVEGKVVGICSVQDQRSLLQQIGGVRPEIGGAQVPTGSVPRASQRPRRSRRDRFDPRHSIFRVSHCVEEPSAVGGDLGPDDEG